jgi:sulfur-oxidizing protein SoxY
MNIKTFVVASLILLLHTSAWAAPSDTLWSDVKKKYFSDRVIEEAEFLKIIGPRIAENGSQVPLNLVVENDKSPTPIKTLYLLVDGNPVPLAAVYKLTPLVSNLNLNTRIRMDKESYLRIVGETSEGKLYMAKTLIDSSGGCGGTVSSNDELLRTDAGKIKLAVTNPIVKEDSSIIAFVIKHPMLSGLQHVALTKKLKPAFYINKVEFLFNEQLIIEADFGVSTSENPYLRFGFTADIPGNLTVIANDNEGGSFTQALGVNF